MCTLVEVPENPGLKWLLQTMMTANLGSVQGGGLS